MSAAPIGHIRQQMPRRGGNSFYRDTRDYTAHAKTLCGADVTDRDMTFRDGLRAAVKGTWPVCGSCSMRRLTLEKAARAMKEGR